MYFKNPQNITKTKAKKIYFISSVIATDQIVTENVVELISW